VFTYPHDLEQNQLTIQQFLEKNYPHYFFAKALPTLEGKYFLYLPEGVFRVFEFVHESVTRQTASSELQAYEAAAQFGKFNAHLSNLPLGSLRVTIPFFHNLTSIFQHFSCTIESASNEALQAAGSTIGKAMRFKDIVTQFHYLKQNRIIKRRPTHHDTKMSNVLFRTNDCGLCVIDWDTTMPGYFISDLGDMMRTYLCPVDEEETDLSRIEIRIPFYRAIVDGYMDSMHTILTNQEKEYLFFSGSFMMYMQAIRFLTDYLAGNKYYPVNRIHHNLDRARNQLALLEAYQKHSKILTAVPK
jgi:Ser/Thr protein kinase RdoA (MazF antagonist)